MNGPHDLGGMQALGPVPREENEPVFHAVWEARTFGIKMMLLAGGVIKGEDDRYARERMHPRDYFRSSYFERWLDSLEAILVERGILAAEELATRRRLLAAHPRGHTRLPRYARGRRGVIARVHPAAVFPDTNALGRGENPQPVYAVRFEAAELWGETAEPNETMHVDIWESHLEAA
jgi:nitrile hydratase